MAARKQKARERVMPRSGDPGKEPPNSEPASRPGGTQRAEGE